MDGRTPPAPPPKKGTVTPLASVFAVDEAQKARQRVCDTLGERQKQLDQLHGFISDNTSLINLVQRLPDELHHPIMVPFGSAAFFPGKLIHTNEFLVLLGEGYFADRTGKQTIDILKRREKALETQVEGLKAVMEDLKAEATFFEATAAEAGEGLVEIREDYAEEASSVKNSAATDQSHNEKEWPYSGVQESDAIHYEENNARSADEDDEYSRIFSRIAELEKEEEEAEMADKSDRDEGITDDTHPGMRQQTTSQGRENSEEVEHLKQHPVSKDGSTPDKGLEYNPPKPTEDAMKVPEVQNIHASQTDKAKITVQSSNTGPSGNKAFSGTIVERNIKTNLIEQEPRTRSSKPVSRFKQQRK